MAKQSPLLAAPVDDTLPLYYTGCNGAFFGPRGCGLGLISIQRHGFAGYQGPAVVTASFAAVADGTLRVTATGGVRVGVAGSSTLTAAQCDPVDGVEVAVRWSSNASRPALPDRSSPVVASPPPPSSFPLSQYVGGAVGLTFDIPAGAVLFAYHL